MRTSSSERTFLSFLLTGNGSLLDRCNRVNWPRFILKRVAFGQTDIGKLNWMYFYNLGVVQSCINTGLFSTGVVTLSTRPDSAASYQLANVRKQAIYISMRTVIFKSHAVYLTLFLKHRRMFDNTLLVTFFVGNNYISTDVTALLEVVGRGRSIQVHCENMEV